MSRAQLDGTRRQDSLIWSRASSTAVTSSMVGGKGASAVKLPTEAFSTSVLIVRLRVFPERVLGNLAEMSPPRVAMAPTSGQHKILDEYRSTRLTRQSGPTLSDLQIDHSEELAQIRFRSLFGASAHDDGEGKVPFNLIRQSNNAAFGDKGVRSHDCK